MKPEIALERLKNNHQNYLHHKQRGDISFNIHKSLRQSQKPAAIVLACSDSRVMPCKIFDASVGEIFTIQTAGNVVGKVALASIEYGIIHLGISLIVMMGHQGCGAINCALAGKEAHGKEPYSIQNLMKLLLRQLCKKIKPMMLSFVLPWLLKITSIIKLAAS